MLGRPLVAALAAAALAALSAAGVADAKTRHCGTIHYDGFEARHIRAAGLPKAVTCTVVRLVPRAWIRHTNAALPDAAREVEFTAIALDWDCFPVGPIYSAERGAAAINIKCGMWRYRRDGTASIGRQPVVRWQAWNL